MMVKLYFALPICRIYKTDFNKGFIGVAWDYWLLLPFYKLSVWIIIRRGRRFKNHYLKTWYHLMNFAEMQRDLHAR